MEPHGFTAVVPEKPASASRRRGPPASRQGRWPSKLIATSRRSIICSHSSPGSHLGSSRQRRGSPKAAARRRIKIPCLSYIIYNKPGIIALAKIMRSFYLTQIFANQTQILADYRRNICVYLRYIRVNLRSKSFLLVLQFSIIY